MPQVDRCVRCKYGLPIRRRHELCKGCQELLAWEVSERERAEVQEPTDLWQTLQRMEPSLRPLSPVAELISLFAVAWAIVALMLALSVVLIAQFGMSP